MSGLILQIATPFVAYYTLKYSARIAMDAALDKTRSTLWYFITYPFINRKNVGIKYIKCICENCGSEQCTECSGIEIVDWEKLKID